MVLHIETPLVESMPMHIEGLRTVWLKMEAVQPSGSFKLRGMGALCEFHAQQGVRRFVTSSGGNAGMAVAYSGRHLGIPVTVVVPQSTGERARTRIASEGAAVIVHGVSWQEANEYAQSLLEDDIAFIHPFADPLAWEGHSTLIDEVARQGFVPDAVVVAVGGGGLLCGVLQGMHRHGWQNVPVIAAETRGADSFAQSVAADTCIELAAITSIAGSLGARKICKAALDWTNQHEIRPVVVSDRSAVEACLAFADWHQIIVEPACGAAISVVRQQHAHLAGCTKILVIVCGGATATYDQLLKWRDMLPEDT